MGHFHFRILILFLLPGMVTLSEAAPSVSAKLAVKNHFLDRGIELADAIFQPSLDIFENGYYAGVLGSYELNGSFDETNLYLGSYQSLNPLISLDGGLNGFILNGEEDLEAYFGCVLEYGLRPAIYLTYEFQNEAFTLEGSLGDEIPIHRSLSLEWSLKAGARWLETGNFDSYQYLTGTANLLIPLDPQLDLRLGLEGSTRTDTLGFSEKSSLSAGISLSRDF